MAAALTAQGLTIEQYYPESGPGQQEISVRYTEALGAADQQVIYRETVKAIARRHGRVASFMPKLFEQAAGLGDAIAALEQNDVLKTALGQPLATTLIAVRRAEWNAMKDFTLEDEVALLLERY